MNDQSNAEDSRELKELFGQIRLVAGLKPNAVAMLGAAVDLLKRQLPTVNLSPVALAMAKHRGANVGDVAVMTAAMETNAAADRELIARLPRERVIMLKAFAGSTNVEAQAARARALGWDRDRPNYPDSPRLP